MNERCQPCAPETPPPAETGCESECTPNCLCNKCANGGCGSCGCSKPEPPRMLRCRVKTRLTCEDKGILIPASCVCTSTPVDLTKLAMWVRRRGTTEWLVRYPAWDIDANGGILFMLDDLFFKLPLGRYEGELRYNGCVCETIEIDYRRACAPRVTKVEPISGSCLVFPTSPMCEVHPVFEAIQGFSAELCGVLERGVRSLPLCGSDKDKLCAMNFCMPVQLVVCDGARSEIVEFKGCENGVLVVDRGMGGTQQARFAPGSKVTFEWTEANIKAATDLTSPCVCGGMQEVGAMQC